MADNNKSQQQYPSWAERLRELLERLGDVLNPPTPVPQPVPVQKRPRRN